MRESVSPVAITARGMVASLGLDAITCGAAARAGLMRSRELPFAFNDFQNNKVERAVGHQAVLLTEGFEGMARLVRLMEGGLVDLASRSAALDRPKTGFYLSLPSRFRHLSAPDLVANEEVRRELVEAGSEAPPEKPYEDAARLLEQTARRLGWRAAPSLRFATTSGHTGVAEAANAAMADLSSGAVDAAIVGGIDSLLEEVTLEWLRRTGRLKSSSAPAGLMPGEAAAFVMLEAGAGSGKRTSAYLRSSHLRQEKGAFFRGDPPSGLALSEVLREAAAGRSSSEEQVWIITDQNGESYRATDWGIALVRALRSLGDPALWYPAISFGDTGAASGAVALCLAVSAYERGYAPARSLFVLSSGDGPGRAAICVTAGDSTTTVH